MRSLSAHSHANRARYTRRRRSHTLRDRLRARARAKALARAHKNSHARVIAIVLERSSLRALKLRLPPHGCRLDTLVTFARARAHLAPPHRRLL